MSRVIRTLKTMMLDVIGSKRQWVLFVVLTAFLVFGILITSAIATLISWLTGLSIDAVLMISAITALVCVWFADANERAGK
ncbi:MAG: hypothetical protein JJ979_09750 [Roseibium sp.]|nr:hypothetical protein [Roseibium sp.]